ncbi:MAG: hypothetical protein KBT30_02285, partial [Clostridiales bacterium]|nr:hypothetical protein [Candidatus Apopatousia equi]
MTSEDCDVDFDKFKLTYFKKDKEYTLKNYVEVCFNDYEIYDDKIEHTLKLVDFMSTRSSKYLTDAVEYFTNRVKFAEIQIKNIKSVKIHDQKLAWKKALKNYKKILKFVEDSLEKQKEYCL